MAHEVYRIGDAYSMAYTGQKPWHGLGQELTEGSPLEVWLKQAHLDWEIEEAPVQFSIPGVGYRDANVLAEMASRKVLYRSDNHLPLAVVGKRYKPVQPAQILYFYQNLIEEQGFILETAGTLDEGRRIWALARLGDAVRIAGQDALMPYLMLATACDGTLSTIAALTCVRVVCNNTLQYAYDITGNNELSVRVPHSAEFNAEAVQMELGLVEGAWDNFITDVDLLAKTPVSIEQAAEFFLNLYHNPANGSDYSDVPKTAMEGLGHALLESPGADFRSSNGTLWGVVNAVTYYYDHTVRARSNDTRLRSSWFGVGANVKKKAWEQAVEMAKAA